MKQVLQNRKGLVVVRDVPEPKCPPGWVVVRNAFSAISSGTERSRVASSQKSLITRARERPDLVRSVARRARMEGVRRTRVAIQEKLDEESAVGYSSAGHVVRVGSRVRGFAPGDRVACAGAAFANHAEIVSVPSNLCAQVPPSVDLKRAALTTIAAIALHGIRLAGVTVGDRVAVVGCGLVGDLACRLLHASGAEVFAIDVDRDRVDRALTGGADHGFATVEQPAVKIRARTVVGVDAVLVTAAASSNEPLLMAAELARDRGTVVLVGDVPVELPRGPLYGKELVFRISRSYGPGRYDPEYEERGLDYPIGYVRWTQQRNMQCVLDLQARGLLDLSGVIADVVPVEHAAEAYDRLAGTSGPPPAGALVLSYPDAAKAEAAEAGTTREPPRRSSAAHARHPSDQVRIGLVGPGRFARAVLVPALADAGASLEIVGGGSGPSADALQRKLGFARVASDERAVFDDPNVDAVVIATRHGSHAALCAAALEAGKHVFCEKPLALDEDELDHVLRTAAETNRILVVGFNRRFSPYLAELRAFTEGLPLIANYRVSAGKVPPSGWVHDVEQGGGRIIGEACHFLDALAYVSGAPITRVAAAAVDEVSLPLQARDNVVINAAFGNGSVGTIVYAAAGSPAIAKERLEVFAGDRTAILDDYRALELYGDEQPRRRTTRAQEKGHREEVQAFLDAVRTGTMPVPLEQLANVSRAAIGVVESLRTGATVSVRATEY